MQRFYPEKGKIKTLEITSREESPYTLGLEIIKPPSQATVFKEGADRLSLRVRGSGLPWSNMIIGSSYF